MNNKCCLTCGSRNLVADRALAGRIVCASCGSTKIKSISFFSTGILPTRNKNKRIAIIIIGLIILLIILIK